MSRRVLSDFPFHLDVDVRFFGLRHEGQELAEKTDRKALLELLRAGEHVEIEVDAVTYIQRKTPNRNFVRFKDGALRAIAKSGVGSPFLKDHAQRDVLSRGGTITASKAAKNEAGEWEFHQTLQIVKPWAVEGMLDGTIDRFSIGWRPTGPVVYMHNGQPLEDWPKHWPGDELEDGTVVEWVFTAADLVETSAVNVPAVVGTGPSLAEFCAQLAAHLGGEPPIPTQETSMRGVLKALGLSADAAEESVLAAVGKLEQEKKDSADRAAAAELELKAEREAHERTRAQLAEHEKREAAAATAQLDADIAKLYEEGRLVKVQLGEGRAQPDSFEADLREIHAKLGQKSFEKAAARLPAKVPVGRQTAVEDPAPRSADVLVLSDRQKRMVKDMGMSEEQFRKNLEKGGQV